MPRLELISPGWSCAVKLPDTDAEIPPLFGLTARELSGARVYINGARGSQDEGRVPVLGPKPKEGR